MIADAIDRKAASSLAGADTLLCYQTNLQQKLHSHPRRKARLHQAALLACPAVPFRLQLLINQAQPPQLVRAKLHISIGALTGSQQASRMVCSFVAMAAGPRCSLAVRQLGKCVLLRCACRAAQCTGRRLLTSTTPLSPLHLARLQPSNAACGRPP